MIRLAIFASGSGTNAENIIRYFSDHREVCVQLVLSNRKDAFVLQRAEKLNVKSFVFTHGELIDSYKLIQMLKENHIDYIILAGFLLKIPSSIITLFPRKILNIHPALLPKYGGKGMYGQYVHEAVIQNKETESGISIHFVNENYDEGELIFQAHVDVNTTDTVESLAEKIHQLEYTHYPKVIEKIVLS